MEAALLPVQTKEALMFRTEIQQIARQDLDRMQPWVAEKTSPRIASALIDAAARNHSETYVALVLDCIQQGDIEEALIHMLYMTLPVSP